MLSRRNDPVADFQHTLVEAVFELEEEAKRSRFMTDTFLLNGTNI